MDLAVRRERQRADQATAEEVRLDPRIGDEISRMLSMIRTPEEPLSKASPRADKADKAGEQRPDWSASLGLAERVGKALRLSGDRARKLEERMESVIQRASEELETAHKRIEGLEARLRAAEAREKQLEARARDAEQYLQRIHETLAEELASTAGLFGDMGEAAGDR
jgi:chromosome segregation ATPase